MLAFSGNLCYNRPILTRILWKGPKYMKNRKTLAIIAGAGANFILGFNFILQKIIDGIEGISPTPLIILAYQCTVCAIVLALCIPIAKPDFGKLRSLGARGFLPILCMGICDPLLYYIGTHYAIQNGASSLYVSVMVATMPVFALIAGAIFLREIPTALQSVFSVLSVVGVVLYTVIAAQNSTEENKISLPIVLFLLLTIAAGVGYGMFTRKASANLTSFERTFGCFLIATVLVDLLALFENIRNPAVIIAPLANMEFIICILIYGVFAFALEYTAYNYSMNYLQASQAMVFSGISTVVTFAAGVIIFPEERVAIWQKLLCVALILAGVVGAQMFGRKEKAPEIGK